MTQTPIVGTMRLGAWGAKMSIPDQSRFIAGCLELGATDFDLADIYGHYTTETEFGKALDQLPGVRDQIRIITKCGIKLVADNRPDHRVKAYDSSYDHIIASAERSLQELQTDHIDTLLIHRPDYLMQPDQIARAIDDLTASGKVLDFGVSNFSPDQCAWLGEHVKISSNQIEISIGAPDAIINGTTQRLQHMGIDITAWSPLGGGLDDAPKSVRIKKTAAPMLKKYDCDLGQLYLAWLAAHPANLVPVIGTSKVDRVREAIAASDIEMERDDWYLLLEASFGHEVA